MVLPEPVDVGADTGRAGFDAAASLVGVAGAGQRRFVIIEEAAHVVVQGALVALPGWSVRYGSRHADQAVRGGAG